MKRTALLALLALTPWATAFSQEATTSSPIPTLPSTILPEGSTVELIKDGFKFTEGPALAPDGKIFFTDIPNDRIHVYDPANGEVSVAREETGGANGLIFDAQGALLACEGSNRIVSRQAPAAGVEAIASDYEGKKLNSPNDLIIDAKGGVYFTDPRYGKKDDLELPKEAVYYLPALGAKTVLVTDAPEKPNGIALSPDGKTLYIADNRAGNVQAYNISPTDGLLSQGRIITPDAPGCDGMTVDQTGNLYVTTKEGVKVFTPTGKLLGVIPVPEGPANCKFGAKGTKTLYITARKGFYKIKLAVDGVK